MGWNADGSWTPEDDSVSSRVSALTSQDSALMRQARTSGMATANRRGLLNSSIAAGAGESAALGTATPIASQDAQQVYGKNVQKLQGDQQMAQTQLQIDADKYKTDQSTASNKYQIDAQVAADRERTTATLAAQDRQALAQATTNLSDSYRSGISDSMQNEKVPAATRTAAQQNLANLYQGSLARLQSIYNVNLSW